MQNEVWKSMFPLAMTYSEELNYPYDSEYLVKFNKINCEVQCRILIILIAERELEMMHLLMLKNWKIHSQSIFSKESKIL